MGKGTIVRFLASFVVGLVVVGGASCGRAAAPLSLEEFRARVVAEIRREHPDAKIELTSPAIVGVTLPGKPESQAFFGDAYDRYRNDPRRLDDLVRDVAGLIGNGPKHATASALVIMLCTTQFIEGFGPEKRLVRPIAGDLFAVVAYDTPEKWVFAPAEELRSQLGMDNEAIWKVALANTRVRADVTPQPLKPNEPVDVITDHEVASSLIADDELWQMPELTGQGPLVVAVLQQDEIYIVPLSAKDIVAKVRQRVKDDPHPIFSRTLLLRRDGRWEAMR